MRKKHPEVCKFQGGTEPTALPEGSAHEESLSHTSKEMFGVLAQIGKVKAAGNSVLPRQYSFTDETPYRGKNYYRLREIDQDGTEDYNQICFLEWK